MAGFETYFVEGVEVIGTCVGCKAVHNGTLQLGLAVEGDGTLTVGLGVSVIESDGESNFHVLHLMPLADFLAAKVYVRED